MGSCLGQSQSLPAICAMPVTRRRTRRRTARMRVRSIESKKFHVRAMQRSLGVHLVARVYVWPGYNAPSGSADHPDGLAGDAQVENCLLTVTCAALQLFVFSSVIHPYAQGTIPDLLFLRQQRTETTLGIRLLNSTTPSCKHILGLLGLTHLSSPSTTLNDFIPGR